MVHAPMLPILLSFAGTAAQPVDSTPVTRERPQLHTPDVIAPAVLPYLACLYASRGLPLMRGTDGSQISYDKGDGDCSTARRRAETDALILLKHRPIPGGGTPAAFVADTLSQMDAYVASLPTRRDPGGSAKLAIVGLPVTIEDEVQPAYNRYEECLKDQVSDTPVTIDTVLAAFGQAMAVCRSVRDSAVTEAEKALLAKGWDATTRARAAESTFAKADESWLTMGRQFRDSLIARLSSSSSSSPAAHKPKHH